MGARLSFLTPVSMSEPLGHVDPNAMNPLPGKPMASLMSRWVVKLEESTGLKFEQILIKVVVTCGSFVAVYVTFSWLLKKMDPTYEDKKKAQSKAKVMLKQLGIDERSLNEYEVAVASNLVDAQSFDISWENIGGLNHVKTELKQSVIFLLKNFGLLKSKLCKPPRGVLLYGPPGCGKTMIAKATAKESGAKFLFLELSSMLDKWYGESQKRVAAIFTLAHKIQPTIIFIDEIDSLLRTRNTQDHEATNMIKTQFMNYWDGLLTDTESQVIIIGATNKRDALDQAILRRMPCQVYVGSPNAQQRAHILSIILKDEALAEDVDLQFVAEITDGFSGSDLHEVCRLASSFRIKECIESEDSEDDEDDEEEDEDDEEVEEEGEDEGEKVDDPNSNPYPDPDPDPEAKPVQNDDPQLQTTAKPNPAPSSKTEPQTFSAAVGDTKGKVCSTGGSGSGKAASNKDRDIIDCLRSITQDDICLAVRKVLENTRKSVFC